ncbi:MAG: F0F1 ATP synthase subunit alpha [Kiritimatiellia bacterium]|jgi:F-type H+-transporting ATPase subunit alpha|nr:F0F1 ATP synthase subunit alpha [Kiritimatiellia bacterium]MDP6809153.1 F0F1 ATP synthase subunit alpha [Kiritimatiellia bacterium]
MALKLDLIKLKENGVVAEVRQDVVHATGLTNCMNGQLVTIGSDSEGVIVGFDGDYVLVLVVKAGHPIKPGDQVSTPIDDFKVPVGDEFLGRRVNALALPIDGEGPIRESAMYPIFMKAPSVLERIPLGDVMETGTKIIDMMKPVGRGQRMLIIGDRMTGKTTIGVDAILNQRGKGVICIYCCIGKSEASLNRVHEVFDQAHCWDYTISVAATASDPMGQQYLAPYVATSLGEYFMYEKAGHVLVVFDDFTKHAWAYRQISLLLERAPGRDAYPGDIFYIHSQLVERAGKLKPDRGGGSMTHLPIVETLQGDLAGYIPSNIVSMTDGQIYFSTNLFGEGFKPAIDMGLSVSRIGSKVQWRAVKKLTGMLQLEFVRYKELEKLTRIKAGMSADVEKRLLQGKVLEEVLKQEQNNPIPMEDEVVVLYALEQGFLEDVAPEQVQGMLKGLVELVHLNCPELLEELRLNQDMSDNIKEGFDEQIARYRATAL